MEVEPNYYQIKYDTYIYIPLYKYFFSLYDQVIYNPLIYQ